MNISTLVKRTKLLLLIFLCGSSFIFGQSNFNVGGFFGGGIIAGNLPSQSSFTSSMFVDVNPGFGSNLSARLSFIYVADFNLLLPGNTNPYNPVVKGFSIKAVAWQNLNDLFYVEEGIGPLALNDQTFYGLNTWDYGITFSAAAGIDFRGNESTGFRFGAGTEYGLTITNTFVRYLSLHLQVQYYL